MESIREQLENSQKEDTSNMEYDFDEQPITDPSTLENVDFEKVQVMSLYGCQISDLVLFDKFLKQSPNLKVLWMNENPLCKDKEQEQIMRAYIEQDHPHIELFNSKFTKHAGEWAFKFVSLGFDLNLTRNTPSHLIRRLDFSSRDLYRVQFMPEKLAAFPNVNQIVARDTFFNSYEDANKFLAMMKSLPNLNSLDLDYYMLDLFWKIKDKILGHYPKFDNINGYKLGFIQPNEIDLKLDRIIENLWRSCGWFSFQVPETDVTVYSLDEKAMGRKGNLINPNIINLQWPLLGQRLSFI
jgi:hypothetical protein